MTDAGCKVESNFSDGIFLVPVSFYVVESWRECREARKTDAPTADGEAK